VWSRKSRIAQAAQGFKAYAISPIEIGFALATIGTEMQISFNGKNAPTAILRVGPSTHQASKGTNRIRNATVTSPVPSMCNDAWSSIMTLAFGPGTLLDYDFATKSSKARWADTFLYHLSRLDLVGQITSIPWNVGAIATILTRKFTLIRMIARMTCRSLCRRVHESLRESNDRGDTRRSM